ncbi:hypothetical protein AMTRI_Chr09g18430 [Amborella trichopoda]
MSLLTSLSTVSLIPPSLSLSLSLSLSPENNNQPPRSATLNPQIQQP